MSMKCSLFDVMLILLDYLSLLGIRVVLTGQNVSLCIVVLVVGVDSKQRTGLGSEYEVKERVKWLFM